MRELQTPADYRAQAAECIRRAEYAKSVNHRMILLDTAQTWLRMADDAELINKKLSVYCVIIPIDHAPSIAEASMLPSPTHEAMATRTEG